MAVIIAGRQRSSVSGATTHFVVVDTTREHQAALVVDGAERKDGDVVANEPCQLLELVTGSDLFRDI